jgi:hypothetical protein
MTETTQVMSCEKNPIPHAYIPAGPIETAPTGPFQPADVHLEAFDAVLAGVDMGAYDHRIIAWLAGLDDTTCRTVASLLWRCRQAGQ